MVKARVEVDAFRKMLEAFAAAGTFFKVDVSRFGLESNGKIAFSPFDAFYACQFQQFDMVLPVGFREVRRDGTEIAVIGRKSPVQLGHQSADGGGVIDENDILFRLR